MCEVMGKGKMRANGLSKVKEGLGEKKKDIESKTYSMSRSCQVKLEGKKI